MNEESLDLTVAKIASEQEYNQYYFELRKLVCWNPTVSDWKNNCSYDQGKNLKIGRYKGTPFMIYSFLKNRQEKTVFWGNYITFPEFRGKGLTFKLFKREFDKLRAKGYRFYCTAVLVMTPAYMKNLGLLNFGIIKFYKIKIGDYPFQPIDPHIKKLQIDIDKLIEYERKVSWEDRHKILLSYFETPGISFATYEIQGEIKGFGILKLGVEHYELCPLLADSPEIAQAILNSLITNLPKDQNFEIYAPCVPADKPTFDGWSKLGFTSNFHLNLLGHTEYKNDFSKTYSVMDLALGI